MSDDFLDSMMTSGEEAEQHSTPASRVVVGAQFESSEEMERAEQAYLADIREHPLEHISLFFADGKLEPLSRDDKATLRANHVTEIEFRELVEMEQTT